MSYLVIFFKHAVVLLHLVPDQIFISLLFFVGQFMTKAVKNLFSASINLERRQPVPQSSLVLLL